MACRKLLLIPALTAYVALTCLSDITSADDTEIYTGTDEVVGTVAPNILLLLDTSGSMASNNVITTVTVIDKAAETYNPNKIYTIPQISGTYKDRYGNSSSSELCPNSKIFRQNYEPGRPSSKPYSNGCNETYYFQTSTFHCRAAVADMNNQGWARITISEVDVAEASPDWEDLTTTHKDSTTTAHECFEDAGSHGEAGATPHIATGVGVAPLIVVPDMTAGDVETHVSTNTDTDANGRWVAAGSPDAATPTTWTDTSFMDDMIVFHPNYFRYLYGWEDYDNDGVYDAGEGYDEEISTTTSTDHGTRLDVLKSVMLELLDVWTGVNVGIMRYNVQSGSRTLYPISKIEDHRTQLKDIVTNLTAGDATPHSEALYEAYNYYRGNYVEFGEAHSNVSATSTRHPTNPSLYRTPIAYGCQANTIIHMTDGRPTRDGGTESSGDPVIHYMSGNTELTTDDVDTAIKALPGFSSLPSGDVSCEETSQDSGTDGITPDNCMDELAEYMANNRPTVNILNDDGSVKAANVSAEPVVTYTIGFALDMPYLQTTADKGKGEYYTANDVDALKTAFTSMIDRIKNVGTRAVSPPGVAVEAFSRSMHLNELYFNLFQPEEKALYPGNLKRYELALDNSGDVVIVDATTTPALDTVNGGFLNSAESWWSSTPDGNDVKRGGMAENLPLPQNVYTYIASGSKTLADASNRFEVANVNIGTGVGELELPPAEIGERDNVINWARGYDVYDHDLDSVTTEARKTMGDPLHSRPTLVVYDSDKNDDANNNDPDMQVITLTNDGFLRAIDSETGVEQWSFIPKETWHVLNKARKNTQATKLYGLDGFITPWSYDANSNGVIEAGDWTRIYFGMRRGGRHYYGLDLTTKNSPQYMWQINGGSGDFATLGQSWPQMQRAVLNVNGTKTRALVVTGGYDTTYDSADATMPDATMGNDLFIVDESTGALIWRAQMADANDDIPQAKMKYAFPAEPVVIDMDNDGYHDRIYAVDIAGQVWRFDIQNYKTSGELVVGEVLASLSTAGGSENRKFYNQPDIAILEEGSHQSVRVNLGSGFRAHPLTTSVNDYFFSITDPYTSGSQSATALITDVSQYDEPVITISDLTDANTLNKGDSVDVGWKLAMTAGGSLKGEKVLAPSITINNEVLFTTYEPPSEIGVDNCIINIGTSRVYSVELGNARPKTDTNEDGIVDDADSGDSRFLVSEYAGIPPSVVLLFPQATGGAPVKCVGPLCNELDFNNKLRRSYWYTPNRDPAN